MNNLRMTGDRATVNVWVRLTQVWCLGVATLLPACLQAQGQLPPGGVSLLPENSLSVLGLMGKAEMGSLETIAVTGQPFLQAHRVSTLRTPANAWELQYGAWVKQPIRKGDVLLARFHLRAVKGQAETGEAKTLLGFATGAPDWRKSMGETIGIPSEWKQYDFPFVSLFDTPANGSLITFELGYLPQSFDIGGFQLITYGNARTVAELPRTRSDYPGQEEDAPWRKTAQERIEKIRKGDLRLRVVDAQGKPVPNALVTVRMQRHGFSFGSAVAADRLMRSDAASDQYRRIILENYTVAVIENHLKWPFWEGAWTHPVAEQAVDWLRAHDIRLLINGPLVWGGWGNLPGDLQGKDPVQIMRRIREHIAKITAAYEDQISEWEVINEPYAQNDLWKLMGYEKMAEIFQLARQAAPNAHLTINDYPPLDGAAKANAHLNAYYGYIEQLRHAGVPLDGIGFQCHFGSSIVSPERVLLGLDRFAAFGLPISITEFDMETADEDLQRRYLRDFTTAAFSHPAVDAIVMWGFWEGQHWMPAAALYRADWSVKPNVQAWHDLVRRDWWTNTKGKTDPSGGYSTRGFYGVYEITAATPDGRSKRIYHDLKKNCHSVVMKLDGLPSTPPAWLAALRRLEQERKDRIAAGLPLLASATFHLMADQEDGRSTPITVTGQPFTQATRFDVARAMSQAWNVQALIVTSEEFRKGDRISVSFWARRAPGVPKAKLTASFQGGGPDYTAFAVRDIEPGPDWQKVEMSFTASDSRAAGQAMLVLQLGHGKQSIEIAAPTAMIGGNVSELQ